MVDVPRTDSDRAYLMTLLRATSKVRKERWRRWRWYHARQQPARRTKPLSRYCWGRAVILL